MENINYIYDSKNDIKEFDKLEVKLISVIDTIDELIKQGKELNSLFSKGTAKEYASGMSQLNDVLSRLAKTERDLLDLTKNYDKISQNSNQTTRQSSKTTQEYGNQTALLREKKRLLNKEGKDQAVVEIQNQQLLNASLGLYNKVQLKLNALIVKYNELAIKKQLGLKLSAAEERSYNNLSAKIQKYDTILKGVDASVGKYSRNVGNYASGFNPLSNSINQLSREMPAFANSVQTGFMAISNNLPIFFDAIGQIRKQNALLRAEGKPTQSVLKQIASSIFSFQTLLSVGVTLLTIYGKDMWEWAKANLFGEKSINALKKAMDDFNEAKKEANKNASKELANLEFNYKLLKDETLQRQDRLKAAKELQDLYPQIFGSMSTEQMLLQDTTKQYKELKDAIIAAAIAEGIKNKIADATNKFLDKEKENLDKIGQKKIEIAKIEAAPTNKGTMSSGGTMGASVVTESSADRLRWAYDDLRNLRQVRANDAKDYNAYLEKMYNIGKAYEIKSNILGKGTSIDKDYLKDLEAKRDRELAVNETLYTIGKKSETDYVKSILSINKDFLNQKIAYLKGNTAEERKLKAQAQLELAKLEKETQEKIMEIRINSVDAWRDNQLAYQKERKLSGEISEKQYWESYKNIQVNYREKIQNLINNIDSKQIKLGTNIKVKLLDNLEKANKEIFDYEKRNLDALYKMRQEVTEIQLNKINNDEYSFEIEKIQKRNDLYNQQIADANKYYDDLLNSAKEYSQEYIAIIAERDDKIGAIQEQQINNTANAPKAFKEYLEYYQKIEDSLRTANNLEEQRKILANTRLSLADRSYLISVQEKDKKIETLEVDKKRLQLEAASISAKLVNLKITTQEKLRLAEINQSLAEINLALEQQKQLKIDLEWGKLKEGLTPTINFIRDSFNNLGLDNLSNNFESVLDNIGRNFKETGKLAISLKDTVILAASAVGDALTMISNTQKERTIANLNEQLKVSQENTDLELQFITSRLDALNAIQDKTKEQIAERNALEDEARTVREQQQQREKLIAIQKAKAEQRAAAQQALISGSIAAINSYASLASIPIVGPGLGAAAAIAAIAFAALQAGLIMSKNPAPQYFVGTDYAKEGWAYTQERGAEIIADKSGNIKSWGNNRGAQITYMEEGDKVLTAFESQDFKKKIRDVSVPDDLFLNYARQSVLPSVIIQKDNIDYDKLADKVGGHFERVIKKYDKVNIYEENGLIYKQTGSNHPVVIGYSSKPKPDNNRRDYINFRG